MVGEHDGIEYGKFFCAECETIGEFWERHPNGRGRPHDTSGWIVYAAFGLVVFTAGVVLVAALLWAY